MNATGLPRYLPRNISECSPPRERRDPDPCSPAQGYANPPIVARSGRSGTKGHTCETLTRSPCAPAQGYDRVSSASIRAAGAVPQLGLYVGRGFQLHGYGLGRSGKLSFTDRVNAELRTRTLPARASFVLRPPKNRSQIATPISTITP